MRGILFFFPKRGLCSRWTDLLTDQSDSFFRGTRETWRSRQTALKARHRGLRYFCLKPNTGDNETVIMMMCDQFDMVSATVSGPWVLITSTWVRRWAVTWSLWSKSKARKEALFPPPPRWGLHLRYLTIQKKKKNSLIRALFLIARLFARTTTFPFKFYRIFFFIFFGS